ncbi:ABC transporter permease [Novosphingobium flavum]|uniref:ABC transporter permease n=1 Tax=Novosphingobium flavum TaxID=1778672 RepID=A0A7X1FS75_9SPHN|nr:ABC transporter permease [Novosphingobium flavum]MBC2665392.1 ABC transporter permease [Novosphingobium flavum]
MTQPAIPLDQPLDNEAEVEILGPPPRARSIIWIVRLASIALVLGSWEFFGRQINPLFMSYPSAIFRAAVVLTASGELIEALGSSIRTLVIGFVSASAIGLVLGLLIGRYKLVDAATDWLVNALYSTPLVAILPLVILWFGLGDMAKLFIVSLLTVFPVLINTAAGVRNVPPALIDVGTAFAASEREIFLKIILPATVPYMMTGLRLGIGRAIIGMVVAEFFTAITGLGAMIVKYGNQYDTASMFVPILMLMLLGIGLTMMVRRAEEFFAPWRGNDD